MHARCGKGPVDPFDLLLGWGGSLSCSLRAPDVARASDGVEVASRTTLRSGHAGSDYVRLKRLIAGAGLLQKQPRFYALVIGVNTALLALCIGGFAALDNPWLQAMNAVGLALISAQLGFQLHDAGHHQMFSPKWKNTLVGFLTADLLLRMRYAWCLPY